MFSKLLNDEGWNKDEEYKKALTEVVARRDPEGTLAVPEMMRHNYERAMGNIEAWPETKVLMDAKFEWGATKGMPVRTPDGWRKLFGQGA